ncbi:MAG: preprotein translocase subunit SecG [Mariniblastus sp.]
MNIELLAEIKMGLLVMEVLLFSTSLFLMLLVLVQRGKGGGLTGALGGMGGQSAFGSKAGDAFTKITIITAAIWIALCMVTIAWFNAPPAPKNTSDSGSAFSAGADEESENGDAKAGDAKTDAEADTKTDAESDTKTDADAAADVEQGATLDLGGGSGAASEETAAPKAGDGN